MIIEDILTKYASRMQEGDKELSEKEVEALQKEVNEMLIGWAPERFAKELYSNSHLSNNSRFMIRAYLSDKPNLMQKVESYREKYQKLEEQN